MFVTVGNILNYFIAPELIIIEKKGMGLQYIIINITLNYILLVHLLKNSFYTKTLLQKNCWSVETKFILSYGAKSYKIEIVHYTGYGVVIKKHLSFYAVKIDQIPHRFSVRTPVYDIQVSQK